MQTLGLNLATIICELAEIDAEGQLPELIREHAADCRGEPLDRSRLFTAAELLHVRAVARALAQLFDLPVGECEAAAREVLLPNPRRVAARELMRYYLGRSSSAERLAAERHSRRRVR